jgi:hypothetical protein
VPGEMLATLTGVTYIAPSLATSAV